ncbi:autotransporter domain-containing protein [Nitrospirillum sp. BR 11164]|uniref:autotransporter domain-containing protein n=1 Tax=Nitrospirillum sp. BR 11164 TaxID=3104324 RepID=UPI002AFE3B6E|nr:autotransporter domain-containing protein [Nitrospirillum sp. BR 11164]MEA1650174.1 autotransporter domain-containing protein [Nitrospirillum sp. BR 11164]
MRTATPTRSKALLLGASVLALATSWHHPARADINVTGTSAAVTITSGNLTNSGTISTSTFIAAVNASGSVGMIANTGVIKLTGHFPGFYGVGITIHGATIAGSYQPATIGLLSNGAGASILGSGEASGIQISGATIGTIANNGTIKSSSLYGWGSAITGAAQLLADSGLQTVTVGTLTNSASGVIDGGINFTGSTIGTLVNSGQIIAQAGFGSAPIIVGSATLYSSSFNGSIYTTQSVVAPGGIGAIMNNAGGTIAGDISVRGGGSTIGIIDNAGLITGSITGTQATIGGLHNEVGGSLAGVSLTGGSIGSLINGGTITPAPNTYVYGGVVNLGASSVYIGSVLAITPSTIGTINNQAGATIAGGLYAQGATIGTFTNAGGIGGGVNLGAYINYGSNTTVLPSSIGTINNQAGGTISGGLAAKASSIGTFNNAGLISGGVNLGAASPSTYSSNGTGYSYVSGAVTSTIGQLTNAAGATITGGSGAGLMATGASIGTLTNAGMIQGSVNLSGASTSTFSSNGTTYSSTYSSVDSTIGTLINKANASITGGVYIGGTVGTFDNAGLIGSIGTYSYNSYGLYLAGNSTASVITNEAGGTLTGWVGLSLNGTDVGTLSNSGLITIRNDAAITGGLRSSYNTATSSYEYSAASIGTLSNAAGGTIQGYYGGIQYQGTIGTLINNGLIAATLGSSSSGISISGSSFYTYDAVHGTYGINYVAAQITALTNSASGTITGATGVQLTGASHIGMLSNDGLIQGSTNGGVEIGSYYYGPGSITPALDTLINGATGTIAGGYGGVFVSSGTLSTLVNRGLITGTQGAVVASNFSAYPTIAPSIGQITNLGTLSATGSTLASSISGTAVIFSGVNVGTLSNSGLVSGAMALYAFGTTLNNSVAVGTVGLVDNLAAGSLIGTGSQAAVMLNGPVDTLRNAGLIADQGTSTLASAVAVLGGTLGTLLNLAAGTITAPGAGLQVLGTVGAVDNEGVIHGGIAAVSLGQTSTYSSTAATHSGSIGTLINNGVLGGGVNGVQVAGRIDTLANSGTITGGTGDGVHNIGSVTSSTIIYNYLPNSFYWGYTTISTVSSRGGTIGTLTNVGLVTGGQSGIVNGMTGTSTLSTVTSTFYGGPQTVVSSVVSTTGPVGGTIGTLLNRGTILGAAGAGIDNGAATAVIGTLANSGLIQGGQTGLINAGTIGTLTNSGTITGAVAAIRDSGTLGPVTNTGVIAGDVIHTAASDLSITGGSGTVFGTLTGVNGARGTLSSAAGNVTLAGNLVLNDSVSIAGHTLVENGGSLVLTAPTTITGTYAQAGGTLTAMAAGGTVGGLQVSGTASISGATVVLTSQYAYGLTSGATYTIVAAGDAASSYASVTALAPGYSSTTVTSTVVGGQTDLIVSVGNSRLTAGGSATIAGGAGTLDQMTGGALAITGGTPTVGSISGGTIALAGGSATLGTISGGTLTQGVGSTIAGTTAVQVQGGSLNLGGTVQAPLAVNGGLVALNGTASGPVTVGSGGTLRGSGVITGAATVAGVLRPGNSPGTLTFTNGLTQGAQSVLSIDIDGTGTGKGVGNYSRVLVTGGSYVIGSGAVLQPNLRGMTGSASNTYTPGLGTDFTIVQAAGGVTGTFAGITQPASGLLAGTRFTALYGSNAIDLYVTPTYGSLASLGASANQQTMGRVVAGLTGAGNADLGTVLKALYGLPTVGASLDALAQIGGSSQANIVAYSLNRGLAATQVLGQRLAAVRDGVAGGMQGTMQAQLVGRTLYTSMASGGDALPVEDGRGAAAGSAPEEGWHFWAQGLGAFTRVDSDGNAAGGHSNTGGGLFGGDRTVAPGVTVGLAGVLLQSTSGGSNETSSYGLSAYGNVDLGDGLFVTGNAGYTYDQYDTARTMGFGGLSRTAFGHTTGDELSAGVTAGYRVRVSNLTLEPQAGIQWLKVGRDGFTETGAGALDLVLQDLDATALQSNVGGRASASWKTDGGTVITPAIRAAWLHDFRDRALTSQAALAGTTFAVTGPGTGANALGIGGGLTLQEGNNLNLYANYDGTLRRHETDHVFTAGFRLSW